MGRPCSTCQDPRRAFVDARLLAGESLRGIATELQLSLPALHRHAKHAHATQPPPEVSPLPVFESGGTTAVLRDRLDLRRVLEDSVLDADKLVATAMVLAQDGRRTDRLGAIRAACLAIQTRARVAELYDREQARLHQNLNGEAADVVLRRLTPHLLPELDSSAIRAELVRRGELAE